MLFPVGALPDDPLQAASRFHAEILPRVLAALGEAADHLTLVFDPAGFAHEDWRRAVVASLARELAPVRVNAVAGDSEGGVVATATYVAGAPGLTGQYLVVDVSGAG